VVLGWPFPIAGNKIRYHPLRLIKSAMLLQQNDNNSQWMIVVFDPSSCVSQTYLPLYLDKERGQYIIQTWYLDAVTSVLVPTTMNALISALKNKQIGCHFCHQLILNEAGAIALRDGTQE
jgi:hypothetical protein